MGRISSGVIGKLLSFVRAARNGAKLSDIKMAIGGGPDGDILTAEYSHPSGDDSVPLVDDYVVAIRIPRTGRIVVTSFVETDSVQKSTAGDKRIYSRNSNREEMVQLWLKSDGTAILSNENGSFTLNPDGSQIGENANGTYQLKADGAYRADSENGSFELRADGSYRAENSNGYYELKENGTMDINTATIDPDGNIVATSVAAPSIIVNGKELDEHNHAILSGSSKPGPTGPNN